MLVTELFEDSWSGPNNAWHNQGQDDQWHGTDDMWHSQEQGSGMVEDFNVANIVTNETAMMSDIITARQLAGKAVDDPLHEKHMYFEFLKHIREKHGSQYSTEVHQKAAKLALAKEYD